MYNGDCFVVFRLMRMIENMCVCTVGLYSHALVIAALFCFLASVDSAPILLVVYSLFLLERVTPGEG